MSAPAHRKLRAHERRRALDELHQLLIGDVALERPGIVGAHEQRLAPPDVADAGDHLLVEQQLAERRLGRAAAGPAPDAVDVERARRGRRAPGDERRVARSAPGASSSTTGALKHTATGSPHLDRPAGPGARAPPAVAGAVDVPRPGHPHVGVQDGPESNRISRCLPLASTSSTVRPTSWAPGRRRASGVGDRPARQPPLQGGGRAEEGVALRHRTGPAPWASGRTRRLQDRLEPVVEALERQPRTGRSADQACPGRRPRRPPTSRRAAAGRPGPRPPFST